MVPNLNQWVKAPNKIDDLNLYLVSGIQSFDVRHTSDDDVELDIVFKPGRGYRTANNAVVPGHITLGRPITIELSAKTSEDNSMLTVMTKQLQKWVDEDAVVRLMFKGDYELTTLRGKDRDLIIPSQAVLRSLAAR